MRLLLALLFCSSIALAQLPVHSGSTMQRNSFWLLDSLTTPYWTSIGLYQNDSPKVWIYRTIANDGYDWSLRSRDKGQFSTSISSGLQSVSRGNDSTYAWLRVNGSGQIIGDVRRIPGGTAFSQAIFADYDSILFAIAGTERFRLISTGASITGTLGLTGLATLSNSLYLGTASSHTGVMRFYSDDDAYYQSLYRSTGYTGNRDIQMPDLTGIMAVSGASQDVSFDDITTSGLVSATVSTGIVFKAQDNSTNATNKFGAYTLGHYTNAEEPLTLVRGLSTSGAGTVQIGGGSGAQNSATSINFYTSANNTTTTGTIRAILDETGGVGRLTLGAAAGTGVNSLVAGSISGTTVTATTGLSTFNGTNAGSATLGAGDSVQVTVTGFTSTGVVMATYTSNTALTTSEIPLAIGNKQTDKFTIFGSNGETVDYFVSKK